MNAVEAVAMVGELFSWLGLAVGVPMLLLGMLLRSTEKAFVPTPIVVVDRDGAPVARWFNGEHLHERALRGDERSLLAGRARGTAFVHRHHPGRMRLDKSSPATGIVLLVAGILLGTGALGSAVSFLPLLP
jgi:hypothetical protein